MTFRVYNNFKIINYEEYKILTMRDKDINWLNEKLNKTIITVKKKLYKRINNL